MEHQAIKFCQVDAFTDQPFAGNPAAVCLIGRSMPPAWMQAVAAEMNLSETAFPLRRPDGDYDLRWFTPTCEVRLCGHATLASAHVLWETGREPARRPIRFHTASGILTCQLLCGWIEMDFPAYEVEAVPPGTDIAALSAALGHAPSFVGLVTGSLMNIWFAVYDSPETVRSLLPNFRQLRGLGGGSAIVTAPGEAGFDFVSRFFAPAGGVDEDPVTGSAHCSLTPYWAKRLGRSRLLGHQVSRRGGIVRVEHNGQRVAISGQAVMTLQGEITPAACETQPARKP